MNNMNIAASTAEELRRGGKHIDTGQVFPAYEAAALVLDRVASAVEAGAELTVFKAEIVATHEALLDAVESKYEIDAVNDTFFYLLEDAGFDFNTGL